MKRSSLWVPMALASYFAFAMLFVAATAHAGVAVPQSHPFKVSGSVFSQEISEKTGDDIIGKDKFNEKVLGANCLFQEKLEKGQLVILQLNEACGGDPNDNEIQVVSTNPFAVEATIGNVDFDDDDAIVGQKKGIDNSVVLPATVNLSCAGDVNVDVVLAALAQVKFDKEGNCISSVSLKNAFGGGDVDGQDVLIDKGKAAASKPKDLVGED